MANVKQDQKVQASSAEISKPKLRLRTRLMETLDRIFTTRQEKLAGEKGLLVAPMGRRRMLALGAAAVLAACAPLPAVAQETTPAQVSTKKSNEVEYQTILDPSELENYFKNAEGKFVTLKPEVPKKIGPYTVTALGDHAGIFTIQIDSGDFSPGVTLNSPLKDINILVVDTGNSNPYVQGMMLVFADYDTVYFQYFNKKEERYELRGVPLEKGRMRSGPIRTGFELMKDGIDVVNAPADLKEGDVVTMASLLANGNSGGTFFKYVGKTVGSETKTVAMR